jgi:hypothetical protein
MANGRKPGVVGSSGKAPKLDDGTMGRFLSWVPGVVDEWGKKAKEFAESTQEGAEDLAWRKVGLGYYLATGDADDIQKEIDRLTTKARNNQTFIADEKSFLVDLYEWIATGGRWKWLASSPTGYDKGLWEAGELLEHYLDGEGEKLEIDSGIYENSVIVKYAAAEMKKVIAADLVKPGKIRNSGEIWSTHVLKPKNFGDATTKGQILTGGVLLAEQGNVRLKYANNRFVLKSFSNASPGGVTTRWRIDDVWDYNSFAEQRKQKRNDVTHLPLRGGKVLKLPDGLSHYLTEIGVAQEFAFYAEWTENWSPSQFAVK